MEKILVLGCPGSGKSTFSKKLSEKLNIPCIYLDKLFWKEGWIERSKDDFDALLVSELEKEKWVMDGHFSRTLSLRLSYADTVIFFDYPRLLCLWRVLKRIFKSYGTTRSDMADGCPERFDWDFIKYVWTFKNKVRRKTIQKLSECRHADIIVIHNKNEYKELEKKLL
ncbi:MAG: AAA family ATPase [Clostridia bacterium]|nr:AAA family ATPase [Clostridia bacterium]